LEMMEKLVLPQTHKMLQTQLRIQERGLVLLGVNLTDAREEIFVRMVTDGIAIGVAFTKAGFKAASPGALGTAASKLFHLPRVQARAAAILEARRTQGVVTLPEVTDMLHRVYAKALHDDQLNAAHNAAFSLARLYGHVTDRAIVETVRKPSRDPDAPAERSLTNWIDALPVRGSGPDEGLERAASASPRAAIEARDQGPSPNPKPLISLGNSQGSSPGEGRRQSGNGAPSRPVTGTPLARENSGLLASPEGSKRKRVPVLSGAQKRKKRRMKDLFG
jgi:hypothetical protein